METKRHGPLSAMLAKNKTGFIAHRGVRTTAPENTLKSIRHAGQLGYEIVELDVQKTADGHYVIIHDKTVDRTTDGTGPVQSFTWDALQQLVIDEEFYGRDPDEVIRIPSFEAACSECSRWGLGINVDCSKMTWDEPTITYVAEMLQKYGLWEHSFFVNNDAKSRRLMKELYPDIHVTWLSRDQDPAANIAEVAQYANGFISYHHKHFTDTLLQAYREANIPVFVYACNTYADVYGWVGKGVRFVETDWISVGGTV